MRALVGDHGLLLVSPGTVSPARIGSRSLSVIHSCVSAVVVIAWRRYVRPRVVSARTVVIAVTVLIARVQVLILAVIVAGIVADAAAVHVRLFIPFSSRHLSLYYRLEDPILKLLYGARKQCSRVRLYNSVEGEPIWMKSGAL